jgi:hypothetical protein
VRKGQSGGERHTGGMVPDKQGCRVQAEAVPKHMLGSAGWVSMGETEAGWRPLDAHGTGGRCPRRWSWTRWSCGAA